jgi:small subunit ribosomal protein S1
MTETTQIETPNPESFAALFEASATRTDQLREGDIVAGTILKVSKDTVVVDIGYKSEGVISLHEFINAEGNISATAGDSVDVLIESTRRRPTSSRSGMRSAPRASVTS